MDFTGQDFPSFIANLDRMHLAVATAMPKAQVPSFSLIKNSPGRMEVEYRSDRAGLEKFVIGLFQGLLDRFQRQGTVNIIGVTNQATMFEILHDHKD